MTLIEALEMLKAKGIARLTGMADESNIEKYLDNAVQIHETSIRYADVPCHRYSLDHEDSHYIVETNGHHIIATHYDGFDMATYSDYPTENEMYAAFTEYEIMRDAEAIAEEMQAKRPGELPREAWVLIATSELTAAHKASMKAFERDFPTSL
jgi:hypothetical protein